jgi:hypothetical protein
MDLPKAIYVKLHGSTMVSDDTVYHVRLGKCVVCVIYETSMRWCVDVKNEDGIYMTVTLEELSWNHWPEIDYKKKTPIKRGI